MRYMGKTRSNLGKNFLHPQKYALPYTNEYTLLVFIILILVESDQN